MNKRGRTPTNLHLDKQAVGSIWPKGRSLPTSGKDEHHEVTEQQKGVEQTIRAQLT